MAGNTIFPDDVPLSRRNSRFGLRVKILAPLFAIAALALSTATFTVAHIAEKELLTTTRDKLLNAALTTGNNLDLQIKRARIDIVAASNVPDVKAVLDPSESGGFGDRDTFVGHVNKLLAILSGASNSYETFYVTSDKGMTLACSLPSAVGTLDVSNRVWFHEAIKSEKGIVSAPFVSRITGDTLIAVALRFSYAGNVGAMIGSLQLGKVIAPALALSAQENLYTAVVTETGYVLSSTEDGYSSSNVKNEPWFSELFSAREGYIPIQSRGKEKALAFSRLQNTSLYAVAVAETDLLLKPVRLVRNVGAFALLLSLVSTYATIYLVIAPVVRDILTLAGKAEKIGRGDLQQTMTTTRNDELGDLSAALGVMLENLKQMIFRAESATRAKSDFLARMSHEIRTPLNAVIGMAYLGQQGAPGAQERAAFTKIHTAAENLLGIINDILDFSKIEAEKLELEHAPFSLRDALGSVVGLLEGRAAEKGLTLALVVDESIPDVLEGDSLRLSQVCINLCTNAVKFTDKGGVTLRVVPEKTADSVITLHVSVEDTGIGIAPEHRQEIFDAFSQADGSITRRFGGTGLGLAICKRIVRLMGGEIWVDSAPGVGSVFHFTAKVAIAADQNLAKPDYEPFAAEIPNAKNAKVLVVEDNELNQEIALGLFELMGITPDLASNGAEAVAVCKEKDFDLIFMDIQMPVMDGFEATRRIRTNADSRAGTTPIIAMTANVMRDDKEKSLAAGMDAHIGKPVSQAELVEAVRHWYGKTSTRKDRRASDR